MVNPFATLDDISMSTFDEYVFVEGEIYKASGYDSGTFALILRNTGYSFLSNRIKLESDENDLMCVTLGDEQTELQRKDTEKLIRL